jgi:hypothetical protein
MPVSACVRETLTLPRNLGGMGISTFKHLAEKMLLIKRHSLMSSTKEDIRQIWQESSAHHIPTDELLVTYSSRSAATNNLKVSQTKQGADHLYSLQLQGIAAKTVAESVPKENINLWSNTLTSLPSAVHNFTRKAFIQVLPTASNLYRWKRLNDASCKLCANNIPQTNKHVLSNCSSPVALNRYTIRHNAVLKILLTWLRSSLPSSCCLHADIHEDNVLPVSDLFNNYRPDIAIVSNNELHTLELTVCHETNLVKSRVYKEQKYANLANALTSLMEGKILHTHSIEVSTLGFISSTSEFSKALRIKSLSSNLKQSIIQSVIQHSFKIYLGRDNTVIPDTSIIP